MAEDTVFSWAQGDHSGEHRVYIYGSGPDCLPPVSLCCT